MIGKIISTLFSDSRDTPIILNPPDHRLAGLQRFQKRQEIRMAIPIHCFGLRLLPGLLKKLELPQGFAFRLDWDRFVAAGGVDRNMTQPLLHNRDVDAGETQMCGRGVTPMPSSELCRVKTDRTVKLAELAASPRCLALPRLGIIFFRYRLALPRLLGGLGHVTATAVGQLCVAPVPQLLALAPPLL